MLRVSAEARAAGIEIVRQDWRPTDISDGDVLADIAKRLLWPENTASHLAAAAKCSTRQAERYLGGREWSGDAVAAVFSEILARRRMRNVKITKR